MGVHIRYATLSDAPILAAFQLKMAEETEGLALPEDTVVEGVCKLIRDSGKGFYLVAENELEDLVACMIVTYEWSDWRDGWIWWIGSLFVDRPFRQQGIFKTMLDHLMQLGSEREVRAIRLYMDRSNELARQVYLRSGFEPSHYEIFELHHSSGPSGS